MFIAKEIAIWKYISPQQKSPLKLAYFTHRELLYSRTNPILTWFRLKSVETNLWQNATSITSQLRSDSSHASSLPHCKLPGFDTQVQVKNRIYIHTPRKERRDKLIPAWLCGCMFGNGWGCRICYWFSFSCFMCLSVEPALAAAENLNDKRLVKDCPSGFSLINWCFKTQFTWHSNHGTKKKHVTTESNQLIIKEL